MVDEYCSDSDDLVADGGLPTFDLSITKIGSSATLWKGDWDSTVDDEVHAYTDFVTDYTTEQCRRLDTGRNLLED